jgi:hypothetical protein
MQLVGFAFDRQSHTPLRAGTTGLSDVSVMLGPNDAGKSTTLGLLGAALAARREAIKGFVGRTAVLVACDAGEFDLVFATIAHDLGLYTETSDRESERLDESSADEPAEVAGPFVQPLQRVVGTHPARTRGAHREARSAHGRVAGCSPVRDAASGVRTGRRPG